MNPIYLNHHYRKVKYILLALMITMGSQVGDILLAEGYFDLAKSSVCAMIFFGSIFMYVYIERKDEEDYDDSWEPPDDTEEDRDRLKDECESTDDNEPINFSEASAES